MSTTRSQVWDHVCTVLMDTSDGKPVKEALRLHGCNNLHELLMMSEQDLNDLKFPDPDDTSRNIRLPVGQCRLVRAIQAFNSFLCFETASPTVDWLSLTTDDFDTFRITTYDPNIPITKFRRVSVHGNPGQATTYGNFAPGLSSPVTPKFSNFMRGVKRDKSHYKQFKLERYWDDWNRGFRATAKTHDMTEILDSSYVASSPDDQAVFAAKQTFMYSVFEEHLQTDMGKTLVRSYESDSNAQKIYAELCSHMKSSAAGKLAASELLREITGTQMHTAKWNGTKRSFILNWKDKVREYNAIASGSQKLAPEFLKAMLQNMVRGVSSLNQIKIQEQFDITKGNSAMIFDDYL